MSEGLLPGVHWLGHATFRIAVGGRVLYIDPWEISDGAPKADLILITHDHHDHCSPEDVERIRKADTIIVGTPPSLDKLAVDQSRTVPIRAGQRISVHGIEVQAVPAYNLERSFHPRSEHNVGYLIRMEDGVLYHAGDTDAVPEIEGLSVDIALLPIGGTYTMNLSEAAELVRRLKPRVVVPMHYGRIVGEPDDGHRFAELVDGAEVAILPEED